LLGLRDIHFSRHLIFFLSAWPPSPEFGFGALRLVV